MKNQEALKGSPERLAVHLNRSIAGLSANEIKQEIAGLAHDIDTLLKEMTA